MTFCPYACPCVLQKFGDTLNILIFSGGVNTPPEWDGKIRACGIAHMRDVASNATSFMLFRPTSDPCARATKYFPVVRAPCVLLRATCVCVCAPAHARILYVTCMNTLLHFCTYPWKHSIKEKLPDAFLDQQQQQQQSRLKKIGPCSHTPSSSSFGSGLLSVE